MFPNVLLQFLCRFVKARSESNFGIITFEVCCSSGWYQRPVFMIITAYYKFQHFDEAEKKKKKTGVAAAFSLSVLVGSVQNVPRSATVKVFPVEWSALLASREHY